MKFKMNVRSNILPKTFTDAAVTLFVLIMIPVVFCFEMFVVLPDMFDTNSYVYLFHLIMGIFLLYNICTNWMAIMVVDTSIKGQMLTLDMGPKARFCTVCECITPPRSWHCNVCNICILKRDHHCMFSSCCIGYYNLRYFMMFLLYLTISTMYMNFYNCYFLTKQIDMTSLSGYIRLLLPLAALILEMSHLQLYIFISLIVCASSLFVFILLIIQTQLILKGSSTYESRKCKGNFMYDMGTKMNIIDALGKKWYLVWLSPFIDSPLPGNGITWKTKETAKAK